MLQRVGDVLHVSGRLTIDTVAGLYQTPVDAVTSGELVVDMSQVVAVDSAAVSLMLTWVRRAQRESYSVRFINLPGNLYSLAHVYGVDDVLQMDNTKS